MSDEMRTVERVTFATSHVYNRQVVALDRGTWERRVNADGSPTLFMDPPEPIKHVAGDSPVILTAGSGICNPDPGIDVVRLDEDDAPDIFNIDHYRVIEDLTIDQEYAQISKTAGIQQSAETDASVRGFVFMVKNRPNETPDHHTPQLPHRINISRPNNDPEKPQE